MRWEVGGEGGNQLGVGSWLFLPEKEHSRIIESPSSACLSLNAFTTAGMLRAARDRDDGTTSGLFDADGDVFAAGLTCDVTLASSFRFCDVTDLVVSRLGLASLRGVGEARGDTLRVGDLGETGDFGDRRSFDFARI